MKNILTLILLVSIVNVKAQNSPIIYGFDKIPKTLLLNPGAEPTYKYHIGIPVVSGLLANGNISEITVADVFRKDGVSFFQGNNFNTKLQDAINRLDKNDYIHITSQIEVLSGGYKISNKDYLSAGYYSELDVFAAIPKDIINLLNKGNSDYLVGNLDFNSLNPSEKLLAKYGNSFSASQLSVKADALGVFHVGVSRRFNSKFTVGTRLKVYFGSSNITSTRNTGVFNTRRGSDNIYEHILRNLDVTINTSGVYDEKNQVEITPSDVIKGTFFKGNLGVGIDLGGTYHISEQIELTASLLDVGFINYSIDNRNFIAKGNYKFSGLDVQYTSDTSKDYWKNLENDFKEKVVSGENKESYSVMRPIKFHSSLAYSFGKSMNLATCHDITLKDFYDNTVGGKLYSVFLPTGPKFAITGFFQHKFSKYLNTKVTYTIDDFSYSNIGLGVSANIWKFNIYGAFDNVFNLLDVADANTATMQFGINFIVN